ncbi:MAG: GNAT family N-acetyltransferase [Lachnospiraceae bacterium]|nr:GNAT family N-acetyltransferase [Lachnospiraceae bacterium]
MVRLRPYKPSDAWHLLKWWEGVSEKEFIKWSAGKFQYPLTIEQLDTYFSEWCLQRDDGWLMTALDTAGEPSGHFILRLVDYEAGTARIGFIVINPKLRGRGLGKEMVCQALCYAFGLLGLKRVSLGVFVNNKRAMACYEAAGFIQKEYVPEYMKYNGEAYGVYEMEAKRI